VAAAVLQLVWVPYAVLNGLLAFEMSAALGVGLLVYAAALLVASVGLLHRARPAYWLGLALDGALALLGLVGAVFLADVRGVALIYGGVGAVAAGLLLRGHPPER
jgi:hypothetical protein